MPDQYYSPVGQCIYCLTKQLPTGKHRFGDEHIIPFALGGNLILREASCDYCAGIINKQIETPVLFKEWGYLRIKRNFPTRSKLTTRRTHVKLRKRDGSPMKMPISDYSCPVPLYKFKQARILSGLPRSDNNLDWTMDMLTTKEEEEAAQRKYPEWNQQHFIQALPYQFARLLAKIGFSYVVAEYGLKGFRPLTTDIVLGQSDDYFLYVGGSLEIPDAIPGNDHLTKISLLFTCATRSLIIVNIRLFSQIRTPEYHVVVGEIDLRIAEHLATFEQHRVAGKFPNLIKSSQ